MFEKLSTNIVPKSMFIKGIIHFTDNELNFEVLQEEFFFNYLEKNGEFLSQSDFDIRLEYDLKDFDWAINPKENEVYGVLWEFKLHSNKSWTDYGYEYDSEIETINLTFDLFDVEATNRVLNDENYFNFEGSN